MGFVNEYIPAGDVEKYGLDEIDRRFVVGGTGARDWTIDRERDIYLRNVANGREDTRNRTTWSFWRNGELLTLRLDMLDFQGQPGGEGYTRWRLVGVDGADASGAGSDEDRTGMLSDLREALLAYKDGGVFAACTSYDIDLDEGV
jgi:hypothetical protein